MWTTTTTFGDYSFNYITSNNFEEDDLDIEKQQLKNDYHDVACCDDKKICECGMKGKSMFSKKTTIKKQNKK
jgi:hypothetical protein